MKTILTALKERLGVEGQTIARALGGTTIAGSVADVEVETYAISFDANGGSGSVSSVSVSSGTKYTLPDGTGLTAPSQKKFGGWVATAAGTDVITTVTVTEDVTVYALWVDA